MVTFDGQCPHCGSDKGFNAFGMSLYVIGDRDYEKLPLNELEKKLKYASDYLGVPTSKEHNDIYKQANFSLAGECRKCHKPIVATCSATRTEALQIYGRINSCKETMSFTGAVESVYPAPTPPYTHPSLPEIVQRAFVDLQKMIVEKKHPPFIIMGCRQVLEASARALGAGKDGDSLHRRILELYEQGLITASLRDWAMIIKTHGNDAAHEMIGTEEQAKELVSFTKVFLQFAFEMPATIKSLQFH